MITVKLYGMNLSTSTNRVVLVCNELGIKYDFVLIDLEKGEHKRPEWIESTQPFGQVPAFEDEDGTKLFESRAICRYLVAKYGRDSGLMPSPNDVKASALFEQAASIEYSAFDPPASHVIEERIIHKLIGAPVDEAATGRAEETLRSKLEAYERILSKQNYLSGDRLTLADLFHLPTGAFLDIYDTSILRSSPNVKRWWEELTARETWKGVQPNPFET